LEPKFFVTQIIQTLKHLVSLTDLCLEWDDYFDDLISEPFFNGSFFSHLRRLTLLFDAPLSQPLTKPEFFPNPERSHSSLECLHICLPVVIRGPIPSSLSSLRIDARMTTNQLNTILSVELCAQLVELYLPWIAWTSPIVQFPNLKMLALFQDVNAENLKVITLATPALERFQFLASRGSWFGTETWGRGFVNFSLLLMIALIN
jgi:hypothetical protein